MSGLLGLTEATGVQPGCDAHGGLPNGAAVELRILFDTFTGPDGCCNIHRDFAN